MRRITKDMLEIYIPYSNLDWMNYKLVRTELTYHHIVKKEDKGKSEISNGALIMPIAHQYLHLIECLDIETYIALNNLFKIVNKQGYEPTREQRELIEYLLKEFESVHKWDKGLKGKLLVQKKYLERGFIWNTILFE